MRMDINQLINIFDGNCDLPINALYINSWASFHLCVDIFGIVSIICGRCLWNPRQLKTNIFGEFSFFRWRWMVVDEFWLFLFFSCQFRSSTRIHQISHLTKSIEMKSIYLLWGFFFIRPYLQNEFHRLWSKNFVSKILLSCVHYNYAHKFKTFFYILSSI